MADTEGRPDRPVPTGGGAARRFLRAVRRLRAARAARRAGGALVLAGALVLGAVLAVVVAGGGKDPAPTPPNAAAIDAAVAPTSRSGVAGATRAAPAGAGAGARPTLDPVGGEERLTNDATPELTGTVGAAPGDRREVTVLVFDGGRAMDAPRQRRTASAAGGGRYAVSALPLPSGTYSARTEQRDAAGVVGSSRTIRFTVDADVPKVTIERPADGSRPPAGRRILFSGRAGTRPGDSTIVTLRVGSGAPHKAAVVLGRWTAALSIASVVARDGGPGHEPVTATAEQSDPAGNTGRAAVTFTPRPRR